MKVSLLAALALVSTAALAAQPVLSVAPAAPSASSASSPLVIKQVPNPPAARPPQQQFPLKKTDLLKRISDEFDQVDADKDAVVTAEEMKAFREMKQAEMMKAREAAMKAADNERSRQEATKRGAQNLAKGKPGPANLLDPKAVNILKPDSAASAPRSGVRMAPPTALREPAPAKPAKPAKAASTPK